MFKAIVMSCCLVVTCSNAQAITHYKLTDVCRFDIDQYCKSIKKQLKRELKQCLEQQEKNLLPRCQDHYKEAN